MYFIIVKATYVTCRERASMRGSLLSVVPLHTKESLRAYPFIAYANNSLHDLFRETGVLGEGLKPCSQAKRYSLKNIFLAN